MPSPGGLFDLVELDIPDAARVIGSHRALLPAARPAGTRVVFLQWGSRPDRWGDGGPSMPDWQKEPTPMESAPIPMHRHPGRAGRSLTRGCRDWRIVDALTLEAGDLVVDRTSHTRFHRTAPGQHRSAGGIRHLLFPGIVTPIGDESARRSAFFANSSPIVVEDTVNQSTQR